MSIEDQETVAINTALSEAEKLRRLKKAKGGTWYEGWQPYCVVCSTMKRMDQKDYGFRCSNCGNMIGWDCCRLQESPLNKVINK